MYADAPVVDGCAPAERPLAQISATLTEVGQRWYTGAATIAEEHVATNLAERTLVGTHARAPHRHRPIVVLTPAGDPHVLAARLLAAQLTGLGRPLLVVGESPPAYDLIRYLDTVRPVGLVISCTMAGSLPAVSVLANIARELALPAVGGGPGFGPDDRRAKALGLAWAASSADTASALGRWHPAVPPGLVARAAAVAMMRHRRAGLVEPVVRDLRRPLTGAALTTAQRSHFDDVGLLFDHLVAAMLVDDSTVYTGFLDWERGLLRSRGLPAGVADAMSAGLIDQAELALPQFGDQIRRAVGAAQS